ncbi:MAG: hypothetical protein Q8P17_03530 [bacterium]|nr:hypothetical protein [bacterium]
MEIHKEHSKANNSYSEDFVLEKSIFNNVFEKDIRRVFIYKKAERLAKALHLVLPAFAESVSLRNRIDAITIGLVDTAILPLGTAQAPLSRELLALSSLLSIARTSGFLSSMNADIISREAHLLLQEVAAYEEPHLLLEESPTLSEIAKKALTQVSRQNSPNSPKRLAPTRTSPVRPYKGHIKDINNVSDIHIKDRRDAVLSVIRNRGTASIKDISTLIRDVSEKTIQRELLALIGTGVVKKQGERRWSTYSLV